MNRNQQDSPRGMTRRCFARLLAIGGSTIVLGQSRFASSQGMLRFETRGGPFARGKQQAETCRNLFLPWMERSLKEGAKSYGVDSTAAYLRRVQNKVERWRKYMESACPEGVEECRGIVNSLGLDEVGYFAVVFRPDLSYRPPQCTVVGMRNSQGRPLVGKTDDIARWELGMNVLETTLPDKGHRHVHFHFAGTTWTVAGMNERGLSMAMTGISGPEIESTGMPSLAALHTVLPMCATVSDAIEYIRALRVNAGGFSLMLGDPSGALSLVEKTGMGTLVMPEQKKDVFAHTNGILDPSFAAKNPAQEEPIRTNSQRRYDNVLRQLEAGSGIEEILRNRSPQGAICQRGEDGMHTDFAVIMNPVEKKLTFWSGQAGTQQVEIANVGMIFS